ncbi:nucleotidyl transferase AbiEii/AbiGii toxin family protein [Bdellovibrionota bacterium FG-2]
MASPIESLLQKYWPKNAQEYENALKEVMQELTLAGLSRAKFFDKGAFYGGTALRVFYGLPRFSEDLDFTLFKTDPGFKLKPYFSVIQQTLESFGFDVVIEEVTKGESRKVESAFLKANTQIHLLKISAASALARKVQSNKLMAVKFEVDVYPPVGFETEVKPLFPPITASVTVLKSSSLFAGKMHAVLFREWKNRVKGRDFYDLLWFLGQNIPLNLRYLGQKMQEGGKLAKDASLTRETVVSLLEEKIASLDWDKAKSDVTQFLRTPVEVEPWSQEFFMSVIPRLKTEE